MKVEELINTLKQFPMDAEICCETTGDPYVGFSPYKFTLKKYEEVFGGDDNPSSQDVLYIEG